MKSIVLALALIFFVPGTPWAQWTNEPPGATVLNDFNFDVRCGGSSGWTCVHASGQIVADGSAPLSPSNVFQAQWVNHSFTDVANQFFTFPGGTTQFYIGFWWKPSNPFHGWIATQQQKIMLLEGTHTYLAMFRKGGTQASSVYGIWMQPDQSNNNAHIPGSVGGNLIFPNMANPNVPLGQWNKLEFCIRASTSPNAQNGEFHWWMNGQELGRFNNINTIVQTFGTIQINMVWDANDGQAVTDSHRFDHVHISRGGTCPSGGTGGPPPGDTTPPSAVTNLQVT